MPMVECPKCGFSFPLLNNCEQAIIKFFAENNDKKDGFNLHEISQQLDFSYTAIRKYVPKLKKLGLVKQIGVEDYHGHKMKLYGIISIQKRR